MAFPAFPSQKGACNNFGEGWWLFYHLGSKGRYHWCWVDFLKQESSAVFPDDGHALKYLVI